MKNTSKLRGLSLIITIMAFGEIQSSYPYRKVYSEAVDYSGLHPDKLKSIQEENKAHGRDPNINPKRVIMKINRTKSEKGIKRFMEYDAQEFTNLEVKYCTHIDEIGHVTIYGEDHHIYFDREMPHDTRQDDIRQLF